MDRVNHFRALMMKAKTMASWMLVQCIMALALAGAGMAYEVTISSNEGTPVAREPSATQAPVVGRFIVRTSPPASDITVNVGISTDNTASPSDYVLTWVDRADGMAYPFTGTVIIRQGNATAEIRLTPTDDNLVEGHETATMSVLDATPDGLGNKAYSLGQPTSATVTIADNDHTVRLFAIDNEADEDSNLNGIADDPLVDRRGVMRIQFDQWGGASPFSRNVAIKIEPSTIPNGNVPIATIGSDYVIKYKICGNKNVGTTSDLSRIGFNRSAPTTGVNFRLMAALVGEFKVPLKQASTTTGTGTTTTTTTTGIIPDNATIHFASDPLETQYVVQTATPSQVILKSTLALVSNIPSGTAVIIDSVPTGQAAPENVVVERTYPINATLLRVGDGFGKLFEGDVFQMPDNTAVSYVVLSDPVMIQDAFQHYSGQVQIRQFFGGTKTGLESAQLTDVTLVTLISASPGQVNFTGDASQGYILNLSIPTQSTRVDLSVEPHVEGDGAEGVEDVRMSLVGNDDYLIRDPTSDTIHIDDRDVTVTISRVTDAGLPNQTGYFQITMSAPFLTRTVDIGYQVSTSPASQEGTVFATIPRFVTLGGSVSNVSALIPINPIATATLPGGYQSVALTLTLDSSPNFRRAGSSSSTSDPSATMNIANYRGEVSLVTTTSSAIEAPTAPPSTVGVFTLSLQRIAGQTGELGVNISVGGTAQGRYDLIDVDNPTSIYPVTGGRILVTFGQQFLPGGAVNSAGITKRIGVRPINNFVADGNQSVQLAIAAGQSYTIANAATPQTVNIIDDEPTISVSRVNDATRPSTSGLFAFTCALPSGTLLTQPVDVYFTYAGSTAVIGTDFNAAAQFITINPNAPGSTAAPTGFLTINPTDTADQSTKNVVVTITSRSTYNNGTASATLSIGALATVNTAAVKPSPGTVSSSSSSGGCGLGSGVAGLVGFCLLSLFVTLRKRRI